MVFSATTSTKLSSASHGPSQSLRINDACKGGHREVQENTLSGTPIQRSKERFSGETSDPRPIASERPHQMRFIQNDDHCTGQRPVASSGLHNQPRPVGRLLACPGREPFQTIPGLCPRKETVPVQSAPFWPKYCSTHIYKTGHVRGFPPPAEGGFDNSVPRRLANMVLLQGGLQSRDEPSNKDSEESRIPSKSQKIETESRTSVRLAGSPLVTTQHDPEYPSFKEASTSKISQNLRQTPYLDSQETGIPSRIPPLRLYRRPNSQMWSKRLLTNLEEKSLKKAPGCQNQSTQGLQTNSPTLVDIQGIREISGSPPPSGDPSSPYRCIPERMGRLFESQISPGLLDIPSQPMSHQLPRIDGGLSSPTGVESSQGHARSPNSGQLHSGGVHPEGRFEDTHSQPNGDVPNSPPASPFLAHNGDTSGRCPERSSGLSFKGFGPADRVVSGSAILRLYNVQHPSARSGPLCHSREPQTPILCSPGSGSGSHRHECSSSRLEQVESHIPVPTNIHTPEGAPEAPGLSRDCSSSSSPLDRQPVVPSLNGVESENDSSPGPEAQSVYPRDGALRLLLTDPQPTFMDFQKSIMGKEFSRENIPLLTSHLRDSSKRQFNSVWQSWLFFCKRELPAAIDRNFCLSYLRYLFEERQLKPKTVQTYKSCLADVIRTGFGVDFTDHIFAKSCKSMALIRPASRTPTLSWSLDRVLEYIAPWDSSTCPLRELLRKTIFLIALASGGRVSEIHALRRGHNFSYVDASGSLVLSPGPDFLAKNENPQFRRTPWRIPKLSTDNNSLCPVNNFSDYIRRTASATSGPLFIHQASGKPLTKAEVTSAMTVLIKTSNPESIPKSHDIRRMASSLAFFNGMQVSDMSELTGWSSTRVFTKHYLKEVSALATVSVVMGRQLDGPSGTSL